MRNVFSELEFQFALMMGYYNIFKNQDNLNFYLPTGREEHDEYASDWFYKNTEGVHLYLQFKNSKNAIISRKNQRRDFNYTLSEEDRNRFRSLHYNDIGGLYEFELYKKNNEFQQHNLLFSKNAIPNSIGLYVAPIFTSRFELNENLKDWLNGEKFSNKIIYKLFNSESVLFNQIGVDANKFSFFEDVIYILPHGTINDISNHHYCFNKKRQTSFHSEIRPLEKRGLNFIDLIRKVNKMLSRRKTTTLLANADENLNDIKKYFKENHISEIRDYKLEKILGFPIKDSTNILTQIESFRDSDNHKYISSISQLYQEIFDIQLAFIYPRF